MKFLRARSLSLKCVRNIFISRARTSQVDAVSQSIVKAGYRAETHKTKTDDGYILTLHRLLPQLHSGHKGSAFLMHGLFKDSSDFIATGPKTALAYYLADNGFDVWLGNARGTKYSTEHAKIDCNSDEFWQFSFNEIGYYDVSAMLDFVLDHTKEKTTFYCGHSQGCSSLLALLSSQPDYNAKISQAHLLTPAIFMNNCSMPWMLMAAKRADLIMKFATRTGRVSISPVLKLSRWLCNMGSYDPKTAMMLYKGITCELVGHNKNEVQITEEALKTFHDNFSPAVSFRQLTHYLQLHVSGKFQRYDFGDENQLRYNSPHPPDYDLGNVTVPTYIYNAGEDIMVSPIDVERLLTELPNVKHYEKINDWNHLDVILGRLSRDVLYKNILKSMNNNH